jgi:hypothetical protein
MKLAIMILLIGFISLLSAENNTTKLDKNITKDDLIKKQVQEQMEKEAKYAKEQRFYQGNEYNLSSAEINEKSLSSIPAIEPDYDFNMDDTYSDEQ